MKDIMIAYCGLNCAQCDAYLATVNDDLALREKVAENWTKLNNVLITPDQIICEGCRTNGKKSVFCGNLCPIRQCAQQKGVETCGACPQMENCPTVAMVHANSDEAKINLKG